ncbi:GAF domain-containing protein [Actinomadura madurae]|uniref:GAF domain-containing protein n=1 Tax=Actinomadura madurae TaxID=1993 RepID=UPI0020266080|nr:GAF domain-containing protein [Actinomadura madurae]MCP9951802.1 GAF domain-containing protein [Actinomadura madurae]MCP9968572.1 GAF domain-containing protein [Actinomadura madurae]MCP9981044.1 GAF domain-containing protein [Actinomadura madurae]MCQ0007456.1 GAF domain-containing protein [Actinomadura madurae]MCQ0017240.1 GAF domain-containing protein [Actinomadura madurae]
MANDPGTGFSGTDRTLFLAAGRLSRALRSMATISRADGVALMLDDPEAGLRAVAGSTAEGLELEYAEQSERDGPAHESVAADHPVAVDDLEDHGAAYAKLARRAAPVRAVLAVPVHTGGAVIGALNFYRSTPGAWTSDQIAVGQSLADTAADLLVRLSVPPPAHDQDGRGAMTSH